MKGEISDVKESLELSQKDIEDIETKNAELSGKVSELEDENVELKRNASAIERSIAKLEDYSRKENLRVYNVEENGKEDCFEMIKDLFSAVSGKESVELHAAHRIGKINSRPEGRPRPIIARLVNRNDRDFLWKNRSRLKDTTRFANIYLDEDLSKASARIRGVLRSARKIAIEKRGIEPKQCRIKGESIVINGIVYNFAEIPVEFKK